MQENIQTLLNVAADQPDTELLLQKHFTCLLSSIWKSSTQTGKDQNLSLNSPHFNRHLMGSVNHPQDLARKPFQGMKITSLSSKLLESALQDSSTSQPNNTVSRSRLQEDQPINKVGLDLTLEFPRDNFDSPTLFPPIIRVSIDGSDSLNYVNDLPWEDNLKASRDAAENRYRFGTLIKSLIFLLVYPCQKLLIILRALVGTKVLVVLFVGMPQMLVSKIHLDGFQTRSQQMI